MKQYSCIIFDADHTLLDYLADEKQAFLALYKDLGMPVSDELLAISRVSSENSWTEAGLYNVTDPQVQKAYHTLYRTHTQEIFNRIFAKFPCHTATAKQAGLLFLEKLKGQGKAFDGALELVQALSQKAGGKYRVAIATNGLSDIQHARLKAFSPYVERVYVSQDLDSVKPLPGFFRRTLQDLGVEPNECLMIGDSLISDIAGAKAVGMDACFFNPKGQEDKDGVADFQIQSLQELYQMV
ncbi:MAG: HAD-IA family hydrolase [Clostridia bacterium]|nr:HAD-IA family hydrolase [Clostridia bacterium]